MSVIKLVQVLCDDCRDSRLVLPVGAVAAALAVARDEGWVTVAPAEPWMARRNVCRRCVEYGRPYASGGVPSWRGLGLVAGQNAACG